MPLQSSIGGFLPMILILVVFLGLMSWMSRRTMKKQQNQRQELENSMAEGSRVMLTSGIYGTLTHVGEKQAIVELAPGTEISVLKQAIRQVVNPEEEEFSFADDESAAEPAAVEGAAPSAEQTFAPRDEQGPSPEPAQDDESAEKEPAQEAPAQNAPAEYPSAGENK